MALPTSPWSIHIIERVAQGPVSKDRLVAETAALVPPGRAYRHTMRDVLRQREVNLTPPENERVHQDEDEIKRRRIRGGQRSIVTKAVFDLSTSGRIQSYTEDGVEMVRQGTWNEVGYHQPARLTPVSREILRAVKYQPILWTLFVDVASLSVPRDQALPFYHRKHESERLKKGYVNERVRPEDALARTGARGIVIQSVTTMVRMRRVAIVGEDARRLIARGPRWYDPDADTP